MNFTVKKGEEASKDQCNAFSYAVKEIDTIRDFTSYTEKVFIS